MSFYLNFQMMLMTAYNFIIVTLGIYSSLKLLIIEKEISVFIVANTLACVSFYGACLVIVVCMGESASKEV